MIIGIADFRGGETQRSRVNPDEARKLKWCGGWETSRGHLFPDVLPARYGFDEALTPYAGGAPPAQVPFCFRASDGRHIVYRDSYQRLQMVDPDGAWRMCGSGMAARTSGTSHYITTLNAAGGAMAHGLSEGDRIQFTTLAAGTGLSVSTDYWVINLVGDPSTAFQIEATPGGGAIEITGDPALTGHRLRAYAGAVFNIASKTATVPDGAPCRIDDLLVFPTIATPAALRVFEPATEDASGNPLSLRTRYLGLKGPLDYSETEKPTVTPSNPHPARQLYALGPTAYTPCDLTASDDGVALASHGFNLHDPIMFDGPGGGVTAGTIYYVIGPTQNTFQLSETRGGSAFDITADASNNVRNPHWEVGPGPAPGIVHGPARDYGYLLFDGPSCVYSLGPAAADRLCGTLDLGPSGVPIADMEYLVQDFVLKWTGTDPAVANSIAGEFLNSDQQVYSSGFELAMYSQQPSHSGFETDHVVRTYKIPRLDSTGRVSRVILHLDTVTGGFMVTGSSPDLTLSGHWFSDGDPVSVDATVGTGAGQIEAGIVYYVVNSTASTIQLSTTPGGAAITPNASGGVGVAPTVRALGIRTASNWSRPEGTGNYVLWLYSEDFTTDWKAQGNWLLPATACPRGHWYDALPTDPGTQGTSAVVLETFPESFSEFSPERPLVHWCYAHRGRSELGTEDYRVLLSNPSLESDDVLADPWITYDVTATFPVASYHSVLIDYTDQQASGGMGYLTDILWYRAERDAEEVWSDLTYFAASNLTDFTVSDVTVTDDGTDADPEVDGQAVPEVLEASHDFPSSARYAVSSDGRIYALCLTWDKTWPNPHWSRPKDMEVSSYQQYDSFPTTTSDPPEESEGEELTDFAADSYEGMGLLARQQSKFVFMDNAFYELLGADPIQGYDFLRRDTVGLRDARTLADCRSELIWHNGTDFCSYGGGLTEPISRGLVDSTLIRWDQPFGAAFARDQYVFFCYHDDPAAATPYCLMSFDLQTRAWRRRYSTSYQLAGICAAEDGSTVYGVMCDDDHPGEVVDLFVDTTDYGGAQTYDVCTQYLAIAPPGEERHVSNAVLEVVTDQTSLELTVDLHARGRLDSAKEGISLTVTDTQTMYAGPDLACDLTGDAVAVRVRYSGDYPPDIHFVGVNVDDAVAG